jgi:methylmalonyl-CoA mutase N-terminal domain/subunit
VNCYTEDADGGFDPFEIDEAIEPEQIARLRRVRETRDGSAVRDALDRLEQAARDPSASIVPPTIDAVRVYATVGEISETLGKVLGYCEADAVV